MLSWLGLSGLPPHVQIRQFPQSLRAIVESLQGQVGREPLLFSHFARALDAVNRWESDLLLRGVLSGSLAERFRRLFDVENIIHNLKRQARVLAETGERRELIRRRPAVDRTHADAAAQQRPGFSAVNRF